MKSLSSEKKSLKVNSESTWVKPIAPRTASAIVTGMVTTRQRARKWTTSPAALNPWPAPLMTVPVSRPAAAALA